MSDELVDVDGLVLPPWASEIRPHQQDAINQIVEHFEAGKRVVVLDAPTGSGKTLIGDLTRQALDANSLYVCSDKGLQDQFLVDFPEARVLKGRSNYLPDKTMKVGGEDITCDDCTGPKCTYCRDVVTCPYIVARGAALRADTAVVNSSYFLAELNGPGRFSGRRLAVIDEADTLEPTLMRWAEVRVSSAALRRLGLKAPIKGAHKPTVLRWVEGQLLPALDDAYHLERDPKRKRGLARQYGSFLRFSRSWAGEDAWIRDYEYGRSAGSFVMKPVEVAPFGRDAIWKHADRFLLMSASTISPEMLVRGLGWEGDYGYVEVPMTFPKENREIIVAPIAEVTRKGKECGEWDKIVPAIRGVLARHPGERVLVHAVSYEMTKMIAEGLQGCGREVFWYASAQYKEAAVTEYAAVEGAVLVAPSLERGVDFAGDLCRVVIVAKVPYPYLGDPQVSARVNTTRDGQTWYTVETIRSMVQMTGRGVRSATDHATSYILDSSFIRLLKKDSYLFPKWWAEALNTNTNPTTLLEREG